MPIGVCRRLQSVLVNTMREIINSDFRVLQTSAKAQVMLYMAQPSTQIGIGEEYSCAVLEVSCVLVADVLRCTRLGFESQHKPEIKPAPFSPVHRES